MPELPYPPLDLRAPLYMRLAGLIKRERATRFSGGAMGYLWAYLTPLAWIALVVMLFKVLQHSPSINVAPELFVATGILPYVLFRQTSSSMIRTVIANRYMLYFKPVSVTELLLASALLELLNLFVTVIVVFGLLFLLFGTASPDNVLITIKAFLSTWALGAGLGRLAAVLGQWSDSFARAFPLLLRPMFWISGIFYTATDLPGSALDLLWYNPLFHTVEMLRQGYFLGYTSPIASAWYPLVISFAFYLLSLLVERYVVDTRRARHRL